MKVMDWFKRTNFLYKLLAVIIAVVLWFYVMGVTDPSVTMTFNDLPVSIVGRDALYNSEGYTVIDGDKSTVSVTVSGSRSKVLKVKAENITVEADVSSIRSAGLTNVTCRVTLPDNDLRVENSGGVSLKLNMDKIVEKEIPVKLKYSSLTEDGFMLGTTSVSPESVVVKGAESEVNEIAFAQVDVPVDKFSSSYYEDLPFTFIDSDKNELDLKYTSSVSEFVSVSIPVLAIKDVPLDIHLVEGGGLTEQNVDVKVSPKVIKVAGEQSTLESVDNITLTSIDLAQVTASFTNTYDVTLPEGLQNIAKITTAEVKLSLVGVSTKSFLVSNINPINPPENTVTKVVESQMQIEIWGDDEIVSQVKRENIKLVVDLSSITEPGTYVVPVKVMIENVKSTPRVTKNYSVHVTVEPIADEEENGG